MVGTMLLALLLTSHLFAANPWIQLSSRNFNLYTDLPPDRATALIGRLETARQALAHFTVYAASNTKPIRVIAFRTLAQYRAYSADTASTAYFLHSAYRDYIVLDGAAPDIYTPAVHEYAHFAIHQQFRRLPRWLDEGLADLYSTVREKEGTIRLGLPLEERLEWLRMDGLAYSLPVLFEFSQGSGRKTAGSTPRSRFYAESWILVHMLRLSPRYFPGFNDFVRALENGVSESEAFVTVFHKSELEVQTDLAHYLKSERIPTSLLRVDDPVRAQAYRVVAVSSEDVKPVLADLRAVLGKP
jgi:hypothetical protein